MSSNHSNATLATTSSPLPTSEEIGRSLIASDDARMSVPLPIPRHSSSSVSLSPPPSTGNGTPQNPTQDVGSLLGDPLQPAAAQARNRRNSRDQVSRLSSHPVSTSALDYQSLTSVSGRPSGGSGAAGAYTEPAAISPTRAARYPYWNVQPRYNLVGINNVVCSPSLTPLFRAPSPTHAAYMTGITRDNSFLVSSSLSVSALQSNNAHINAYFRDAPPQLSLAPPEGREPPPLMIGDSILDSAPAPVSGQLESSHPNEALASFTKELLDARSLPEVAATPAHGTSQPQHQHPSAFYEPLYTSFKSTASPLQVDGLPAGGGGADSMAPAGNPSDAAVTPSAIHTLNSLDESQKDSTSALPLQPAEALGSLPEEVVPNSLNRTARPHEKVFDHFGDGCVTPGSGEASRASPASAVPIHVLGPFSPFHVDPTAAPYDPSISPPSSHQASLTQNRARDPTVAGGTTAASPAVAVGGAGGSLSLSVSAHTSRAFVMSNQSVADGSPRLPGVLHGPFAQLVDTPMVVPVLCPVSELDDLVEAIRLFQSDVDNVRGNVPGNAYSIQANLVTALAKVAHLQDILLPLIFQTAKAVSAGAGDDLPVAEVKTALAELSARSAERMQHILPVVEEAIEVATKAQHVLHRKQLTIVWTAEVMVSALKQLNRALSGTPSTVSSYSEGVEVGEPPVSPFPPSGGTAPARPPPPAVQTWMARQLAEWLGGAKELRQELDVSFPRFLESCLRTELEVALLRQIAAPEMTRGDTASAAKEKEDPGITDELLKLLKDCVDDLYIRTNTRIMEATPEVSDARISPNFSRLPSMMDVEENFTSIRDGQSWVWWYGWQAVTFPTKTQERDAETAQREYFDEFLLNDTLGCELRAKLIGADAKTFSALSARLRTTSERLAKAKEEYRERAREDLKLMLRRFVVYSAAEEKVVVEAANPALTLAERLYAHYDSIRIASGELDRFDIVAELDLRTLDRFLSAGPTPGDTTAPAAISVSAGCGGGGAASTGIDDVRNSEHPLKSGMGSFGGVGSGSAAGVPGVYGGIVYGDRRLLTVIRQGCGAVSCAVCRGNGTYSTPARRMDLLTQVEDSIMTTITVLCKVLLCSTSASITQATSTTIEATPGMNRWKLDVPVKPSTRSLRRLQLSLVDLVHCFERNAWVLQS